MSTEPWPTYLPEINAGRHETGIGPGTWLASGAMWTNLATMVTQAMGVAVAELAAVGINWQGLAPAAMGGAVGPFMGWLAQLEVVAAANAMACYAVADAFLLAAGTMTPLLEVNGNRVSELMAEATNFFGVNTGLIAMLNAEYARYWGNNGAVMMTYDQAVQAATIPKPTTPPPPLANALGANGEIAQAAARAAAQQALGATNEAAQQTLGQSVEGASQGTGTATEAPQALTSMMGSAGQLISAPTQALQQVSQSGGGLTKPLESIMQPLQSMFDSMGGSTTDAAAFGYGPGSAESFTNAGAFGGAADSSGTASSGGGGMLGGGLGGGSMLSQSYMGASGGPVKSQQVFSGVPTKGTDIAVVSGPAPGGVGGGGMAPMMHGAANQGPSTSNKGRMEPVIAVPDTPQQRSA